MDNFDLKKYLAEGRLIREEEQGYILYTTNVEYDNGKTGYMYQLVNSEDGEENEIGFDQLYFVGNGGDNDQQVFYGKNFKNVDMGSYQEEKVSKEQAIKLYKELTGGSDGKEDNLRDYWSEWAAGEVEVGNENVIDAGGINADFGKVPNETMNTFKDYVKAVKALNANSKELRNDIAGAVSSITFSDGGFEDYEYDVLTADQFSKIQDIV